MRSNGSLAAEVRALGFVEHGMKSKVHYEMIKVLVAMQQGVSAVITARSNHRIYGFAP